MIDHERDVLYDRINRRVDIMMEEGLLDEVKSLVENGYNPNLNSMQGIGYKELISYIKGDMTLSEAVEAIKQNSRRYAKRQLTWFRRNEKIHLLNPQTAIGDALNVIKNNG